MEVRRAGAMTVIADLVVRADVVAGAAMFFVRLQVSANPIAAALSRGADVAAHIAAAGDDVRLDAAAAATRVALITVAGTALAMGMTRTVIAARAAVPVIVAECRAAAGAA